VRKGSGASNPADLGKGKPGKRKIYKRRLWEKEKNLRAEDSTSRLLGWTQPP
jgi:hypothetical protein